MKRAARVVFLVTFALLQCVAPLAHAHIGGDASGGRFHIFHFHDGLQKQAHDHVSRMSSGGHASAASDHPAVKVPDGKRRHHASIAVLPPAMDPNGMRRDVPAVLGKSACLDCARITFPSPYFKRHSQAPPRGV
jgi:hypothetical protein